MFADFLPLCFTPFFLFQSGIVTQLGGTPGGTASLGSTSAVIDLWIRTVLKKGIDDASRCACTFVMLLVTSDTTGLDCSPSL